MKSMTGMAAALSVLFATSAFAAPLQLLPADPQPEEGDINPGLAVKYAYPKDVKTIADAEAALEGARDGKPLTGLDYADTTDGDLTLTSRKAHKVAAEISGFVRFEAAGTYTMDFLTNDGLLVNVGGQEVGFYDGRHPCETTDKVDVAVPKAGWYALKAIYFQRKGGACLHMRMAPEGSKPTWVDDAAFGYTE